MVRGLGAILLAAGIAALIFGVHAAFHSRVSPALETRPGNQIMWFYVGGIVGIVLGAVMVLLPSRRP
ncbi:MAG TPA: DUF3185 family protein [Verrucomicrobiae bacterium]|nr:DUF3185 family protein [Verrucomicrobiae bacterium]